MVMTDEQLETLKKQIVVYQILSERLLRMYQNSIVSAQLTPGLRREEGMQCYPPPELKITTRQRWCPTTMQLQVLMDIFEKGGDETPERQKVREITSHLSQYGVISEANVYNWFQNRRARNKKIQKSKLTSSTRTSNYNHKKSTLTVDNLSQEDPKNSEFDYQPKDLEKFCSELLLLSKDAEDNDSFA